MQCNFSVSVFLFLHNVAFKRVPVINKIHSWNLSAVIEISLFNADCTTVYEYTATEDQEQNKLANNTLWYTLPLDTVIFSQYVVESGHSSDESAKVLSWKPQKTEHSFKDSISKIWTILCLGYIKIQTQLKGPILCNIKKKEEKNRVSVTSFFSLASLWSENKLENQPDVMSQRVPISLSG